MSPSLTPAAGPLERPLTIAELTATAREVLEAAVPPVWVVGEVSGFKRWSSGHWYFTLKDADAQVRCTVWRSDTSRVQGVPEDGLQVFARGHLTVYAKRGEMQFIVRDLLPTAAGGFYAALLERARASLEKDGLLDPARKRPLPRFPRAVGVVTSAEGAAWRDVVAVVGRRWPLAELVLVPAQVQGEEAPADLCRALALAGRCEALDVLIVGRGGGSKEDLWAFNDERVARAVAASPVPVISAVGHETDVSLTDLVADERAATPSAAAEKAVPDRGELIRRLDAASRSLGAAASRRVEFVAQRLAHSAARMGRACERLVERGEGRLRDARVRMAAACERALAARQSRLAGLAASLDALSPLKVLERGFAVARDAAGRVLRRTGDFPPGLAFRLRLVDGEVRARREEDQ